MGDDFAVSPAHARLTGATFFGGPPLDYIVHLRLADLTVVLGPNGSGKSTALRGFTSNMVGMLDDPATLSGLANVNADLSVLFLELDHPAVASVITEALEQVEQSRGLSETFPSGFPVGGWTTTDLSLPVGWRDRAPIDVWVEVLRQASTDLKGADLELVLQELRQSRTIAVEPIAHQGRVRGYWCLPRDSDAADTVRRHRESPEADLGDPDVQEFDHLIIDDGPVVLAPIGFVPSELIPTAVSVPSAQPDDVLGMVRHAIAEMVIAVRAVRGDDSGFFAPATDIHGLHDDGPIWLAEADDGGVTTHPAVSAVLGYAGFMIEQQLPGFIADDVGVTVSIQAIGHWRGGPELTVTLRPGVAVDLDDAAARYPLAEAADGHRIWLELAILETARRLHASALAINRGLDEDSEPPQDDVSAGADTSSEDPVDFYMETIAPFADALESRPRIYVIDEPERHLHPALGRQAARWLAEFAGEPGVQVLIATHSPHFLRLTGDAVWNYADPRVIADNPAQPLHERVTRIHPFSAHELTAFSQLADRMGFDRGELLAGVSLVLFVEGMTDRDVLEELFGREFHSAGVAIFPAGGAAEADRKGLADAEIVMRYTTALIAFLVDKVSNPQLARLQADPAERRRVISSSSKNDPERRAMATILQTAAVLEREVVPLSVEVDDIFDLLDEGLLRERFPRFQGHAVARQGAGARQPQLGRSFIRRNAASTSSGNQRLSEQSPPTCASAGSPEMPDGWHCAGGPGTC